MIIGVANIQRLEHEHFIEWFSYYLIQGVTKFILYTHSMPNDPPCPTASWIKKLQNHYDITHNEYTGLDINVAYGHCQNIMDGPRKECDWLIWADSDEYYFPIKKNTVKEVLEDYLDKPISALGIYWLFFGSNNIEKEPNYITQSFNMRSNFDYWANRHTKPIVKGKHAGAVTVPIGGPHLYNTEFGTFDTSGNLLTQVLNHDPCHDVLRINHYYCHSYDWFSRIKQHRGPGEREPGAPGGTITKESFDAHDKNDVYDDSMWERYGSQITEKVAHIKSLLELE